MKVQSVTDLIMVISGTYSMRGRDSIVSVNDVFARAMMRLIIGQLPRSTSADMCADCAGAISIVQAS